MIVKSMYKNGAILCAFALATTGSVAVVQSLTETRIAEQEKAQLMSLLSQVIPSAVSYTHLTLPTKRIV